jgi:hypothetical protein
VKPKPVVKLRNSTKPCECGHIESQHAPQGDCRAGECFCPFFRPPSHSNKGLRLADLPMHESGLRLMDRTHPAVAFTETHTVPLPPCCPVSNNPRPGSVLIIEYEPQTRVLEVYSLRNLVRQFQGGFPGIGKYPAERNMEGMIQLIGQMCADALAVQVKARAILQLDAGHMEIIATAEPQ